MARYPGAVWKPLSRNYSPGARTAQLGLILHVQAGNGELSGWFSNPSAQASSTFWVSKTGEVVQYMEAGTDKSWAQAGGNALYDSVETEGQPTEKLTDAQVTALAALVKWEHDTYGMPYTVISTPGAKGFGWHGMGGAAWGGHTGCPGDLRKAQMPQILALAQKGDTTNTTITSQQEDSMIFVIFENNGRLGIYNPYRREYQFAKSKSDLEDMKTVITRTGGTLEEWKALGSKSNKIDNLSALGSEVK